MNLISGLEDAPNAFFLVSTGSVATAFMLGWGLHHIVSGKTVQKRAAARMEEINVLSSALRDMTALDYTVKTIGEGTQMNREEFKNQLAMARYSRHVSEEEADLLFDVLNRNKDDFLNMEDFDDDSDDESDDDIGTLKSR